MNKTGIYMLAGAMIVTNFGTMQAADYSYSLSRSSQLDLEDAIQPAMLLLRSQQQDHIATAEIQYDLLQILQGQVEKSQQVNKPRPEVALEFYMLMPNQALLDFLRDHALADDFTVSEWLALFSLENGNVTPLLQQSFDIHGQSESWQGRLPIVVTNWMGDHSRSQSVQLLLFLEKYHPDVFKTVSTQMNVGSVEDKSIKQLLDLFYKNIIHLYNPDTYNLFLKDPEYKNFKVNKLGIFLDPNVNPLFFDMADRQLCKMYGEEYEILPERYITLRTVESRKLDWLPSEVTTYIADEYAKLAPKFADQEKALAEAEAAYIAQYPDRASKPIAK